MSILAVAGRAEAGPKLKLNAPAGHPRVRQLALDLWHGTCGKPLARTWSAPAELAAYLEFLYAEEKEPAPEIAKLPAPEPLAQAAEPGTCWVAYSGGKDGLATALMARDAGLKITLYHIAGLNKSVAREEAAAARAGAAAAGMELVVEDATVAGARAGFVEVPTRNQVVVTLMLARMLEAGQASAYSMGNAFSDVAQGYLVAYSDLVDAVALWHRWLQVLVPGLEQRTYLRQQTEAVAVVAEHGLLEVPHGSCMAPPRFRGLWRATNEAKYGPLLPGRCGSCGKCCWEYVVLDSLGYLDVHEGFLEHCLRYMQRRMREEGQGSHSLEEVRNLWVNDDVVRERRAA